MVAGKDAFKPGEAKNSWLTGTAAWNFYAISRYILGIQPQYEGLLIDPCIPAAWKGFEVVRKFRGAVYDIKVRNPKGVSKGVASRSEEHTSELQSRPHLVCRLLLEKKKGKKDATDVRD